MLYSVSIYHKPLTFKTNEMHSIFYRLCTHSGSSRFALHLKSLEFQQLQGENKTADQIMKCRVSPCFPDQDIEAFIELMPLSTAHQFVCPLKTLCYSLDGVSFRFKHKKPLG